MSDKMILDLGIGGLNEFLSDIKQAKGSTEEYSKVIDKVNKKKLQIPKVVNGKSEEEIEKLSMAIKQYNDLIENNGKKREFTSPKAKLFTTEENAINSLKQAWNTYVSDVKNNKVNNNDILSVSSSDSAKEVLKYFNVLEALTGDTEKVRGLNKEVTSLVDTLRSPGSKVQNYNYDVTQLKPVFDILKDIKSIAGEDLLSSVTDGFKKAVPEVNNFISLLDVLQEKTTQNSSGTASQHTSNSYEEQANAAEKATEKIKALTQAEMERKLKSEHKAEYTDDDFLSVRLDESLSEIERYSKALDELKEKQATSLAEATAWQNYHVDNSDNSSYQRWMNEEIENYHRYTDEIEHVQKRLQEAIRNYTPSANGENGKELNALIVILKDLHEEIIKINTAFTEARESLSKMGKVEADFSPLLDTFEKIDNSITSVAKKIGKLSFNMTNDISIGSNKELDLEFEQKVAKALNAYKRLFDHIKMSSAGGQFVNDAFFQFNLDDYDSTLNKLYAIRDFIEKMRSDAKSFYNRDVLFEDTEKTFWNQAKSAIGQVTRIKNKIEKHNEAEPINDLFGKTDLTGVIDQLEKVISTLKELNQLVEKGFTVNDILNGKPVDTGEEVNGLTAVKKSVESITEAVNEKTNAFQNEGAKVAQVVSMETGYLGKLISALKIVNEQLDNIGKFTGFDLGKINIPNTTLSSTTSKTEVLSGNQTEVLSGTDNIKTELKLLQDKKEILSSLQKEYDDEEISEMTQIKSYQEILELVTKIRDLKADMTITKGKISGARQINDSELVKQYENEAGAIRKEITALEDAMPLLIAFEDLTKKTVTSFTTNDELNKFAIELYQTLVNLRGELGLINSEDFSKVSSEINELKESVIKIPDKKKVEIELEYKSMTPNGELAYRGIAGKDGNYLNVSNDDGVVWWTSQKDLSQTRYTRHGTGSEFSGNLKAKKLFEFTSASVQWQKATYLGDGSDELSVKITDLYNKIETLKAKKEELIKTSQIESQEYKDISIELGILQSQYDAISNSKSNMYGTHMPDDWAKIAKRNGYDGLAIHGIDDDTGNLATSYAVWAKEQIENVKIVAETEEDFIKMHNEFLETASTAPSERVNQTPLSSDDKTGEKAKETAEEVKEANEKIEASNEKRVRSEEKVRKYTAASKEDIPRSAKIASSAIVNSNDEVINSNEDVIRSEEKVRKYRSASNNTAPKLKTTSKTTSTIKDTFDANKEASEMEKVATTAKEAAQSKKEFATANEGVQASVDGSKSKLQVEVESMEAVAKSAREAADAKQEFAKATESTKINDSSASSLKDILPSDEDFNSVISKLNIIEEKAKNISKITKSSVWNNSKNAYDESYNVKYKDGSNEIYGENSEPQVLRGNNVLYDAKTEEREARQLLEAQEQITKEIEKQTVAQQNKYKAFEKEQQNYLESTNKINKAILETDETLGKLSTHDKLDAQFFDLLDSVEKLNEKLKAGELSVAEYNKSVKSLTSEYSKLVNIQQRRDVEEYNAQAKNGSTSKKKNDIDEITQAYKNLIATEERYQKLTTKKSKASLTPEQALELDQLTAARERDNEVISKATDLTEKQIAASKEYAKVQEDVKTQMSTYASRLESSQATGINNKAANEYEKLYKKAKDYHDLKQKEAVGSITPEEIEILKKLQKEWDNALHAKEKYSGSSKGSADSIDKLNTARSKFINNNLDEYNKSIKDFTSKIESKLNTIETNNNRRNLKYVSEYYESIEKLRAKIKELNKEPVNVATPEALARVDELKNEINTLFQSVKGQTKGLDSQVADIGKAYEQKAKIQKILADNTAMPSSLKEEFQALDRRYQVVIDTRGSQTQLEELNAELSKLKYKLQESGKTGKSFFSTVGAQLKSMNSRLLAYYFSMYDFIRYARYAINAVVELDNALLDLKKTTTMTDQQLENFYSTSNDIAKKMGVTTAQIIEQASAWSRLGYSSEEAATTMAQLSSQFASISPGMETDQAQEGLVSIMKANIYCLNVQRCA